MPGMGHVLPQLGGELFLTDGGIETSLIFQDGLDLPLFAAFDLLKDATGTQALRRYFRRYRDLAREAGTGFVFESPTWRASRDWGDRLGYSAADLASANAKAMALGAELRREAQDLVVVLSGCVGPRGDGYRPEALMTGEEAQDYHAEQVTALAAGGAEMVTAITMTHVGEALGVARAAAAVGLPVAISFTVETDGSLPGGEDLGDAIAAVDDATGGAPAYYMINCAHPTHFAGRVAGGGTWTDAKIASDVLNPAVVGNRPRRQAKFIYQLTPQYDDGTFTIGANIVGTSSSYTQDSNQLKLPGFTQVNGFVSYRLMERVQLSVNANNLFDVKGFTEAEDATIPANGIVRARSINGRTISASVRYQF